jgi:uncharacterized protein
MHADVEGLPVRSGSPAQLDPMLHIDRYRPWIAFECADVDTHVPPDGAERFKGVLAERHPAAGARVTVTRHAGRGHLDGARDEALLDACLRRLTAGGDPA